MKLPYECPEGGERTFGSGYTELYAAFEVLRSMQRSACPKADVFAFGVLMWELTHGGAPGQLGTNAAITHEVLSQRGSRNSI